MRRPTPSLALCAIASLLGPAAHAQIIVGDKPGDTEQYAAKELQRYFYQLSGTLLPITGKAAPAGLAFVVGTRDSNPLIAELATSGVIKLTADDPGPQGYVLKKLTIGGESAIVVAGSDAVGVLYGVYGLLDDHFGIGFYMDGDVLPSRRAKLQLPDVDERKTPAVTIRGFLPWTNFPQSATVYSWEDWKFIIDQTAKMRMNFIHIHNYNGQCDHNEMYHNFAVEGLLSRVWMPTARTGHRWSCPGWDVNDYRFGAADLFDDYDFGADCALHNENLTNEQVFRKGTSLFQKVIRYAHTRGVRIGLGLDINLIPREYKMKADDPRVIDARVEQIASDYPDLDYLLCFQSEGDGGHGEAFFKTWRGILRGFYDGLKTRGRSTRIAVAGWGIAPEAVAPLPADVICAPISAYSDGCETGAIYGQREYWGCPWLERDFRSSEYYYPYNMHLSNTIKAWKARAANMKGFYCLTWRLTDAISPKLSYMAKAPWDPTDKYGSSRAVYHEYASRNYGPRCAEEITSIINENEPFGGDFGECQGTPALSRSLWLNSGYLFNLNNFSVHRPEESKPPTPAASYADNHGTQKAPCSEGGECIGFISSGDWLRYDGVDFGNGPTVFEARVASPEGGGEIEIRLDGPQGKLLGRCKVPVTDDWQKWQTVTAAIESTTGKKRLCLVFKSSSMNDEVKAVEQLATVDRWIERTTEPAPRARLSLLRCRLAAVKDYIKLSLHFPNSPWDALPGSFASWAGNFTHRVTDISSLGNVQSSQNRFVQLHYVGFENTLRNQQSVGAPSHLTAKGTREGAVLNWRNEEPRVRGYNVYRGGRKLNAEPLPVWPTQFVDRANGLFAYAVSSVRYDAEESPRSVAATCPAGSVDRSPPFIVVISPPTSVAAGHPFEVKARVLDERCPDEIAAVLVYRSPGQPQWKRQTMARRIKAVFTARVPAMDLPAEGVEYYVEVTDGTNSACFPAAGPAAPLSSVVYAQPDREPPGMPQNATAAERQLKWSPAAGDVFWYRIYRSRDKSFSPSAATLVTYVHKDTTTWTDNAEGFDGVRMTGTYYYRISAVDVSGNESPATEPSIPISWPDPARDPD